MTTVNNEIEIKDLLYKNFFSDRAVNDNQKEAFLSILFDENISIDDPTMRAIFDTYCNISHDHHNFRAFLTEELAKNLPNGDNEQVRFRIRRLIKAGADTAEAIRLRYQGTH